MKFFVFGINHKSCPVEIREKLSFDRESLRAALRESRQIASLAEIVILSTCNRVEIFGTYASPELPENDMYDLVRRALGVKRETYEDYIELRKGKEAVNYIFRVAGGLESLVVGENEILGQLRDAFREANEAGTVHSLLYRLMEKSLKAGKEVRHRTKINEGAVSIPSVALELAEKIFGRLSGEKVMVLGTGEMGTLTLRNLRDSGAEILYVVSRDREKGEAVAAEFGAEWLSIENWEDKLAQVDILITSTASREPIVVQSQVERVMSERKRRPLFLIDIAVPRDIDVQVNAIDDVYLYNIDDLKGVCESNLRLRRKEVRDAEELTAKAGLAFSAWLEQLTARPVLQSFEGFLDEVLDTELGSHLKDLDDARRLEIRLRIRSRLVHHPMTKIKEASLNGGVKKYLEALQSLFSLEKPEEKK